ncbi:hypothetical protein GCM10009000_037560 [Halobacterium noricense]
MIGSELADRKELRVEHTDLQADAATGAGMTRFDLEDVSAQEYNGSARTV